jgi:hypothetical protein
MQTPPQISLSQTLHASEVPGASDDGGGEPSDDGPSGRRGRLLAAIAVLALTAAAVTWLVRLDRARTTERVTAEAQAAALRAADGIKVLTATLEAQTHNATANPRLVAALNANVDQETLRDLLLTEPWWEPFRRAADGFGLYDQDGAPLVSSRLPATFDVRIMVQEARQTRRTSSSLLLASGQVLAVAACPIALAGRSEWPVLVSTKVLDVGLLAGMAERAGGAVAISDGRRLLVAATTDAASGTGDDLSGLKRAVDTAAPGHVALGSETVAALPLPGGLRVLAGVAAPINPGGLPIPWSAVAILIVGVTFSVGLYLMLARQAAEAEAAFDDDDGDPLGDASLAGDTGVGETGGLGGLGSIGRYAIVDRIGQGGMAEIFSAVTMGEGSFRRPVVIKRLRPELTADPNAVAQFCDEANLLAALHHPNIVAVQDFGRSQNQFFLAEEYVFGRDLGRLVARRLASGGAPLPVEVIAYVACELLKGLEYAHGLTNEQGRSLGIVHRDVSPENVMVSARGEVKLLDFGVVKADEGRVARTEMGVVKGNVTYMSPEQARGLDVDARADLYSLALVMFTCAAGSPLYAADTSYTLLMRAGAGPGPDERAAIRALPAGLAAVIDRATAAKIGDRFPTAHAMAAALEPLARSGATATAALIVELFGAELKAESHRMATFVPESSSRSVAGLSDA